MALTHIGGPDSTAGPLDSILDLNAPITMIRAADTRQREVLFSCRLLSSIAANECTENVLPPHITGTWAAVPDSVPAPRS